MSFFTLTSNSVILTYGSRTPIQGIVAVATTSTLSLSTVFYFLVVLSTYYQ